MSGHNKWSKIKHRKEATDTKKSKIFGMHAKKIAFESRQSGGDIESPGLRNALTKARADNMPNENIERAIKKGSGSDAIAFEEVRYETYGPGGVALIIEGITDNKNRTTAEIKHIFSKRGMDLAATGAALWAFTKTNDEWVANQTTPISEADGEKLGDLIDLLDEHEDVKNVYTNAE
ncbi:MAG: YebC/PmpR family DNA-binding transcriptional regulator [bacterium]|nr:YebC/PmpR family DNA-binding transcriptional regulator [bacterium]